MESATEHGEDYDRYAGLPGKLPQPGGTTQMHFLTCIVWLSLTIFSPFAASGTQPTHNFSDKSVSELLALLESTDPVVRHCAAIFIGDRYRNPKASRAVM